MGVDETTDGRTVGILVGMTDGIAVGITEATRVGTTEGAGVGGNEGAREGNKEGKLEGTSVGVILDMGAPLGDKVGADEDGRLVSKTVGIIVGANEGYKAIGTMEGWSVDNTGTSVGLTDGPSVG